MMIYGVLGQSMDCVGQTYKATIPKSEAAWYWLEVDEQTSEAGVLVHCLSTASSKYKVILFDKDGGTRQFEDSSKKSRLGTEAGFEVLFQFQLK